MDEDKPRCNKCFNDIDMAKDQYYKCEQYHTLYCVNCEAKFARTCDSTRIECTHICTNFSISLEIIKVELGIPLIVRNQGKWNLRGFTDENLP